MKTRPVFTLALVLSLAAGFPLRSQDVSEYEKRLVEISNQIKELRARIQAEEKKESSILARLDKLSFQKNLIQNEIKLYHTRLGKNIMEITAIRENIPELETQLEEKRDGVEQILASLYKYGRLNYVDLVLKVDDAAALLTQNKQLTVLARHQENLIAGYLTTLEELEKARDSLENKQEEINILIRKAEDKKRELQEQENRQQRLINEINQDKQAHTQMLKELKDRAEQLQNLMKKLLEEDIRLPFPLLPLYEKKGILPWPISGKVISRFGVKRHPRFNTMTKNNGIEISPLGSTVVKCIHPGVIVYADYIQGYGNLIIVDHGMSYYTLYGHCSEFLVKKGDPVQKDAPIAIVGDTGSLEGPSLYLEIRHKARPLDPLQWLNGR
jgi:murein hydrolase activator